MNNGFEKIDKARKHEDLRDLLRQAIISGRYKPGECIPSQNVMARDNGVSTSTVREAISSLVHEGLLMRVQGKGTFVAGRIKRPVVGITLPHLFLPGAYGNSTGWEISARIISAIEEEARKRSSIVALRLAQNEVATERQNYLDLLEEGVQGIIAYHIDKSHNIDCVKKIVDAGIPLVLMDRYLEGIDCDYVGTDHYKGAFDAVSRLIDMGYTRIVLLTHFARNTTVMERTNAVMAAAGGDVETVEMKQFDLLGKIGPESAVSRVEKILKQSTTPTALFTVNSGIFNGVTRIVQQLEAPALNIAYATFDNIPSDVRTDVPLIRVNQPWESIGCMSMQLVAERMQTRRPCCRVVLRPTIEVYRRYPNELLETDQE